MNFRCRGYPYHPHLSTENQHRENNFISETNSLQDGMANDVNGDFIHPCRHFEQNMQTWRNDWDYQKAKYDCLKLNCLNVDDDLENVEDENIQNENIHNEENKREIIHLKKECSRNNDFLKISIYRELAGKALCLEVPMRLVCKSVKALRTFTRPKAPRKRVIFQESKPVDEVDFCAPFKFIGLILSQIWKALCIVSSSFCDILESSSRCSKHESQDLTDDEEALKRTSMVKRKKSDCTEVKILCCGNRGMRVCEELIQNAIESNTEMDAEGSIERDYKTLCEGEIDKEITDAKQASSCVKRLSSKRSQTETRNVTRKQIGRSISKPEAEPKQLRTKEKPKLKAKTSRESHDLHHKAQRERTVTTAEPDLGTNLEKQHNSMISHEKVDKDAVGFPSRHERRKTEAIKKESSGKNFETPTIRRDNRKRITDYSKPGEESIINKYQKSSELNTIHRSKVFKDKPKKPTKATDSESSHKVKTPKPFQYPTPNKTGKQESLQVHDFPDLVELSDKNISKSKGGEIKSHKQKSFPVHDSPDLVELSDKDVIKSKHVEMKTHLHENVSLNKEKIETHQNHLKKMVHELTPMDDNGSQSQKDDMKKLMHEKTFIVSDAQQAKDQYETIMNGREDLDNLYDSHQKVSGKVDFTTTAPIDVRPKRKESIISFHRKMSSIFKKTKSKNIAETEGDIPPGKEVKLKRSRSLKRFLSSLVPKKHHKDEYQNDRDEHYLDKHPKDIRKNEERKEEELVEVLVVVHRSSSQDEIEEQERKIQEMITENKKEHAMLRGKQKSDPVTYSEIINFREPRPATNEEDVNNNVLGPKNSDAEWDADKYRKLNKSWSNSSGNKSMERKAKYKQKLDEELDNIISRDSYLSVAGAKKSLGRSKRSLMEDKIVKRQAAASVDEVSEDSGNSITSENRSMMGIYLKKPSDSSNSSRYGARKLKIEVQEEIQEPTRVQVQSTTAKKSILKQKFQEFPPIPETDTTKSSVDYSDMQSEDIKSDSKVPSSSISRYFKSFRLAMKSLIPSRNKKPKINDELIDERKIMVSFHPNPEIQRLSSGTINTISDELPKDL